MATKTVISNVNLAHPGGGPPLPAGVPVEVDASDEFVKAHLEGGFLTEVKRSDAPEATPEWSEDAPAITAGQTDLHTSTPENVAGDAEKTDKTSTKA